MGSQLGVSDDKILALGDYATSPLYNEAERVALEYADGITLSNREVDDSLFRMSAPPRSTATDTS